MMDAAYGFHGWGLGWIFMILLWSVLILGVVALIRWLSRSSSTSPATGRTALDILEERYARGDIEKEEFEQKKRDLTR